MILASAAVVLAAALFASAWLVTHRSADSVLRGRIRETVLVTLKSGAAFSGVLYASDPQSLVLVSAVEASQGVPIDGELIVRWAEVLYVQKP